MIIAVVIIFVLIALQVSLNGLRERHVRNQWRRRDYMRNDKPKNL
jgi:hypothetical protein